MVAFTVVFIAFLFLIVSVIVSLHCKYIHDISYGMRRRAYAYRIDARRFPGIWTPGIRLQPCPHQPFSIFSISGGSVSQSHSLTHSPSFSTTRDVPISSDNSHNTSASEGGALFHNRFCRYTPQPRQWPPSAAPPGTRWTGTGWSSRGW